MLYKDGEKYFTQAPEVVNDLTTGGTTKALSAEQGKVLKNTIDNLPQGGHTIKNDSGTSLTQRDNLKFVGVYTSDDGTNNKTDVQIVREFQSVAEIESLTGEAKKGFEVTDGEGGYCPYTGSDILFDKTGTSFTGDNVQDVLEEVDDKINGTLIKSIPANTYNTYALALAELETVYDTLTDKEKVKSVIIRGDRIIYRLNYRLGKVYIYTSLDSLNMNIQSFDLSNHKYYQGQLSTTPAFVVNENSNGSQSEKLDFYII